MAKDDYRRIVCLILTYLYARLKGKTDERPEVYIQPMTKDFPISEDYLNFVLNEMLEKGLIKGVSIRNTWGGEMINTSGVSRIQITGDGIEYLCDNKSMRTAMEWLRDNFVSLPGIVSTIIDLLA